jgi:hypothetical protein
MPILPLLLVGTCVWGQAPPALSPKETQEATPYRRIVDTVLPSDVGIASQVAPEQVMLEEQPTPFDVIELGRRPRGVDVWGLAGINGYFMGERMAPNGVGFQPIFSLDSSLNIGILPNQKLYLFVDTLFWGQKANPRAGITNPKQGSFDFSKREFDINIGFAWNYTGPWEFRIFAYADNNLNRGNSRSLPQGYSDGVGLENRYYLPTNDKYDLAKKSFLTFGFYPTKAMISGDGQQYNPGFFARAYLTQDLPWWNTYLFLDTVFITEQPFKSRILYTDGGLGIRPFGNQSLEFRLGFTENYDMRAGASQILGYGGFQILF